MSFCTVVLTSTRQHFSLINVDKVSIQDLLNKSSLVRDSYKLIHIKCVPNTEDIFLEKKSFFENLGFEVIRTDGEWSNDDSSHGQGLIKDMQKVYNYPNILKHDYVFHVENDWIFKTPNVDNYLNQSISILVNNPNIIYSRHTRADQKDIVRRLNATYTNGFFITDREFSFNPFIARPRDMKYISNFVANNNTHPHVEMAYEMVAKFLNNENYIFSFINSDIVNHIGCPTSYNKFINK